MMAVIVGVAIAAVELLAAAGGDRREVAHGEGGRRDHVQDLCSTSTNSALTGTAPPKMGIESYAAT